MLLLHEEKKMRFVLDQLVTELIRIFSCTGLNASVYRILHLCVRMGIHCPGPSPVKLGKRRNPWQRSAGRQADRARRRRGGREADADAVVLPLIL